MQIHSNYEQLTPDTVINAVESLGYLSDFRILPLNSYENRVYQVGLDQGEPIIAKFYRAQRWSDEQILEEHEFTHYLYDLDIPVVPPLSIENKTLFFYEGFRFALYPRQGGQAPELDNGDHLEIIGRFIGRIHRAGQSGLFQKRPSIDIQSFAIDSRDFLLKESFIPQDLVPAYDTLTQDLIDKISRVFSRVDFSKIRLHGDCHPGNILWRHDRAHFVDFDDARNGPAIQDLWMLLSGDYQQRCLQLADILEGYSEFCDFNPAELQLIEPLRTMRLLHYAAWLARRWSDPAFPLNFPWFNTERYWAEHILSLREQLAALDEPVIKWM
jgi:Ser/Thr protein kinase RdoA (MazF antagonist)